MEQADNDEIYLEPEPQEAAGYWLDFWALFTEPKTPLNSGICHRCYRGSLYDLNSRVLGSLGTMKGLPWTIQVSCPAGPQQCLPCLYPSFGAGFSWPRAGFPERVRGHAARCNQEHQHSRSLTLPAASILFCSLPINFYLKLYR